MIPNQQETTIDEAHSIRKAIGCKKGQEAIPQSGQGGSRPNPTSEAIFSMPISPLKLQKIRSNSGTTYSNCLVSLLVSVIDGTGIEEQTPGTMILGRAQLELSWQREGVRSFLSARIELRRCRRTNSPSDKNVLAAQTDPGVQPIGDGFVKGTLHLNRSALVERELNENTIGAPVDAEIGGLVGGASAG